MTDEKWLPAVGWEGFYEVSNHGNVRGLARTVQTKQGSQSVPGRAMNPWLKDGYLRVRLRAMSKAEICRVHRLVAEAFVPNPNSKPNVNHVDFNTTNNKASNLEWCTQKENLNHSRKAGRMPGHWKGKRSPTASLPDETVLLIRQEYQAGKYSMEGIAVKHQTNKKTVMNIIHKRTYRHV